MSKRSPSKPTLALALCLMLVLLMISAAPAFAQRIDPRVYIPPHAYNLFPAFEQEVSKHAPSFVDTPYFLALSEVESCVTLTHSRCLRPDAQLKSSRELGVGLGQFTIAYRADGSVRFDTFANMRKQYPVLLKDFHESTIRQRTDLQVLAMVLLWRDGCKSLHHLPDKRELTAICDAAYNGGLRDILNTRRVCGLAANCDPNKWFGNLERMLQKSDVKIPMYGNKSPRDINIHHVQEVMNVRMPKYVRAFELQRSRSLRIGLKAPQNHEKQPQ